MLRIVRSQTLVGNLSRRLHSFSVNSNTFRCSLHLRATNLPASILTTQRYKFVDSLKSQIQVRGMANHNHKRLLKAAKGYRGRANRCYRIAIIRVQKARQRMYVGRKQRKRNFRRLWIMRINAAARQYGLRYAIFIRRLKNNAIGLNRKVLADLAVTEPLSFRTIIEASNPL